MKELENSSSVIVNTWLLMGLVGKFVVLTGCKQKNKDFGTMIICTVGSQASSSVRGEPGDPGGGHARGLPGA